MPNAPHRRARQSKGNACALVVCDSRYAEYAQLHETVYAALGHFGVPYRVHDLAVRALDDGALGDCAVVVLAQENVGLGLTRKALGSLLAAVADGLGLVNLDYNLTHYDDALRDALGLAGTRHDGKETVGAVEAVSIATTDHYLTHTQGEGRLHRLRTPVPGTRVKARRGSATILAELDDGAPAVVAGAAGRGRIVQWLVSPRIWTLQVFGHAHGLDDLFWKGIVWAARKPFAMLCMPPFVRFRFDDCYGLYRSPRDMALVNELNRRGHKPNMCVCMNALTAGGWKFLKQRFDAGKVEVAPHTWDGGVSLYYGQDGEEYSRARSRELIRATAAMLRKHRITPSKILSDHEHEYSANVFPHVKALGIEYKMNVMLPGETWSGVHVDWKPAPYGSMSYALDYTPGPDRLFVVFNHYPAFDHARSYLSPRRFLLNRAGGYGGHMWDFLNGLTTRDKPANDTAAMADRLAEHTRLGINSLFFGGSISHSHFTQALSIGEWRAILDRYERLTARIEKINVGYDDIAVYARSKFHTRVTASRRHDGAMAVRLGGRAEVPLQLSVFSDKDGVAERRFVPAPPFSGTTTVAVPA